MEGKFIYREDVLEDCFEQKTIPLKKDYEGSVIATLIRRLCKKSTNKAILYIHGFNDYFFQADMAKEFNAHGYNFYALDLRKYGRSFMPHQKFNDVRNLKSYYEEIIKAIRLIRQEKNDKIILLGHSTGGLILTLFAKDYSNQKLFDALILNSPFYEFNQGLLVKMFLPTVSVLGKIFPRKEVSGGFSEKYGESIHYSSSGEWEYDLEWKPHIAPKVNLGWIRAVYIAQRDLKKKFQIKEPILIMHSAKSSIGENDEMIHSSDIILQVKDINRIAHNIEGRTEIVAIEGALHDLILSKKVVRNKVYSTNFKWLPSNNL